MFFIYLDETDDDALRYSAFTGIIFHAHRIADYRSLLVQRFRTIFNRKHNEAMPFEHLHACELPNSLSDDQKIAIFDAFAEAVALHAGGVYRVGYGWDTSVVASWSKAQAMGRATAARSLSLSTITFSLMQDISEQMCFVCELDRNNLERVEVLYNYTELHHQELQLAAMDPQHAQQPPLLGKVVGNLYAPKRDMPMQAADFVSYQLKAMHSGNKSEFKNRIISSVALYSSLILRNDTILTDR